MKLIVQLGPEEFRQLDRVARRERRTPQAEAAFLIALFVAALKAQERQRDARQPGSEEPS